MSRERAAASGWEFVEQKVGKNRAFFDYNNLREYLNADPKNYNHLMNIYKALYPVVQDRLYRFQKSEFAEEQQILAWKHKARPAPSSIRRPSQLVNSLYDVAHLLASPNFTVARYRRVEKARMSDMEAKLGHAFNDVDDYRDFMRFLGKYKSTLQSSLKYELSYVYKAYSDTRNNFSDPEQKLSAVIKRFTDEKESKIIKKTGDRNARVQLSKYEFKRQLNDYIKRNKKK